MLLKHSKSFSEANTPCKALNLLFCCLMAIRSRNLDSAYGKPALKNLELPLSMHWRPAIVISIQPQYMETKAASAPPCVNPEFQGRAISTTKVWNSDQGLQNTLRTIDASIERLRVNYIDLLLIHWPAAERGQFVDTW
jgi:hypothetical protein